MVPIFGQKEQLKLPRVCITGGAGYVGSALVPHLIRLGYDVTVLDLFWFGDNWSLHDRSRIRKIRGDIRNPADLRKAFAGQDAVIHLACISNDPSFEIQPKLGKSINYDCFSEITRAVVGAGVKRFLYASSSSVYGVKDLPNVTEAASCMPLTEYSRFKLLCEHDLRKANMGDTEWAILRPATVCGYAPRLRLDLTVNILTISALVKKVITVHGGNQLRPNLNIKDMVRAYAEFLKAPKECIHRKAFNIGFENKSVSEIAQLVKSVVEDEDVKIQVEPTKDHRSYHINSDLVFRAIGFKPENSIRGAIKSLVEAYREGKMDRPMINENYYNIRKMHQLDLGSAG